MLSSAGRMASVRTTQMSISSEGTTLEHKVGQRLAGVSEDLRIQTRSRVYCTAGCMSGDLELGSHISSYKEPHVTLELWVAPALSGNEPQELKTLFPGVQL